MAYKLAITLLAFCAWLAIYYLVWGVAVLLTKGAV